MDVTLVYRVSAVSVDEAMNRGKKDPIQCISELFKNEVSSTGDILCPRPLGVLESLSLSGCHRRPWFPLFVYLLVINKLFRRSAMVFFVF